MKNNKILIVDDEKLIFDAIVETLGADYRFYYAENGKVGLEQFKKQRPNLIILDIIMPIMNGM